MSTPRQVPDSNKYAGLVKQLSELDVTSSSVQLEGGSKRSKKYREDTREEHKDQKMTADAVKNMLHATDITGTQHLQKMSKELQSKGAIKDKSGFMEKEAEFIKELKEVQEFYLVTCKKLLRISIFALVVEFVFACFCIFYFGCGVGDCENGLVCSLYYIKFFQTLFLINTY